MRNVKDCPFCGAIPKVYDSFEGSSVVCENLKCPPNIKTRSNYLEWNERRPLEMAESVIKDLAQKIVDSGDAETTKTSIQDLMWYLKRINK